MARIACLMMQKDEALLLKPWLLWHGYLFGYENLFVWDNGSTDPAVKALLARFEALGVNVDASHTTADGFSDKGNLVSEKIKEFRAAHRYDVALPLDCDEFVAIETAGGISGSRNAIMHELQRIEWHHLICRTAEGLYSLPGQFEMFQRVAHEKSIAAVRAFEWIDHGFHQAKLPEGAAYAPTSLIYLHLHFRPYAEFIARAKDKLRPWTDPDDVVALQNYQGVGNHLIRYLFMTEAEYYAVDFGAAPRLSLPLLREFLAAQTDEAGFRAAWCGPGGPGPAPAAVPETDFETLRAAGLKAMEADDYARAAQIWAQCRTAFPDREEGYLYGAVAAKAAGDEALLRAIHAVQEQKFPNVFS